MSYFQQNLDLHYYYKYYIMRLLMKKIVITFLILILLSANTSAGTDGENNISKKNKPVKDCFENLNRATFALNEGLDKAIFKPVAKGYRKLPSPVRTGTNNALINLSSLITIPNNILQGELKIAAVNTGRFAINTTVGILGIFDVAQKMGFSEYEKEDYGQTFGSWGVGAGCYIVLPVLGPSTIRDTTGSFVNVLGGDPWYNVSASGNNHYLSKTEYMTTKILGGVNFRANNLETIENLEKNSMDFYASVRSLYLQSRQRKILNSNSIIEILYEGDEGDWEEIKTE
jgi:phospholipid-binding lipoprotein MlaA